MRAGTLILALALATTAVGALAAEPGAESRDSSATATENSRWYQAGPRVVYGESQRQKLEQEGFPQYNN